MPYKQNMNRVEICDDVTFEEVDEIFLLEELKYIQISNKITDEALELLNTQIFSKRKNVQFRIYGFYNQRCDLTFLGKLTNVVDLNIGEIDSVSNLEVIESLVHLKKLRLILPKFDNTVFLEKLNHEITHLIIGSEDNSKLDLSILGGFQFLEELFLYKINFETKTLIQVANLKSLTINNSKITDFSFLKETNVEELSLGFTDSRNFVTLYGNAKIKKLKLWKIKGLYNLDILTYLPSLEYVKVFQISTISTIPDLSCCVNLRTLILDELKNLSDISNVALIRNLENIELYQAKSIQVSDIALLLQKCNFKYFKCFTGSKRKDNEINQLVLNRSKGEVHCGRIQRI